MTLDDVMEKTTIALPRLLDLKEAEKLIYHIAVQLPGNVNYHISHYRSFFHDSESRRSPEEKNRRVLEQDGTVSISVNINSHRNVMAFDVFQFCPSREDTSKLAEIRFQTVPDWELSEYRPEIQKLWDDTRRLVGEYFKTHDVS